MSKLEKKKSVKKSEISAVDSTLKQFKSLKSDEMSSVLVTLLKGLEKEQQQGIVEQFVERKECESGEEEVAKKRELTVFEKTDFDALTTLAGDDEETKLKIRKISEILSDLELKINTLEGNLNIYEQTRVNLKKAVAERANEMRTEVNTVLDREVGRANTVLETMVGKRSKLVESKVAIEKKKKTCSSTHGYLFEHARDNSYFQSSGERQVA